MHTLHLAVAVAWLSSALAAQSPPTGSLVLHLAADSSVQVAPGGAVTAWQDLSGHGHHASALGNGPQFVSAVAAIGNKPSIRFDGTQALAVAGQVLTSQQFTIVALASDTNDAVGHREIFSNWSDPAKLADLDSVFLGTTTAYKSDKRNVRFTDDFLVNGLCCLDAPDNYQILAGVARASDACITADKSTIAHKGSPLSWRDLSPPYVIGLQGNSQFDEFWRGDIVELLVYDRALADCELALVWIYLASKYALPFAQGATSLIACGAVPDNSIQWCGAPLVGTELEIFINAPCSDGSVPIFRFVALGFPWDESLGACPSVMQWGCLGAGANQLGLASVTSIHSATTITVGIPNDIALVGASFASQGAFLAFYPDATSRIQLTQAARFLVGN